MVLAGDRALGVDQPVPVDGGVGVRHAQGLSVGTEVSRKPARSSPVAGVHFSRGGPMRRQIMKVQLKAVAFAAAALALGQAAWAGEAEAKKWVDSEFQPSTLSKDQQMAEMKWFIDAAKKLQAKGVKEISVVSETITTHEYESKTLAKAFEEITGIKVKHDLIQEGDVVEKLQTSMQSGKSIYDGWISDSDLIGTHYRYGKIMSLTDYMAGAGKEWTNPGIDLKDYIGTKFTTGPDGKMYQLPDQQFANLSGSVPICSTARTSRTSSRPSTATTWACR